MRGSAPAIAPRVPPDREIQADGQTRQELRGFCAADQVRPDRRARQPPKTAPRGCGSLVRNCESTGTTASVAFKVRRYATIRAMWRSAMRSTSSAAGKRSRVARWLRPSATATNQPICRASEAAASHHRRHRRSISPAAPCDSRPKSAFRFHRAPSLIDRLHALQRKDGEITENRLFRFCVALIRATICMVGPANSRFAMSALSRIVAMASGMRA